MQDRLDAAVDYHQENPRAMIIVSGGKGLQEKITEALAMERYLISQGISSDHIIKEEKATSTYENFLYSKEILEKQLGIDAENHTVAFVTSEYNVFRAASVAEATGFEHVTHIHSTTRWYSALPSVLRECLAIVKFWLLRN